MILSGGLIMYWFTLMSVFFLKLLPLFFCLSLPFGAIKIFQFSTFREVYGKKMHQENPPKMITEKLKYLDNNR